MTNSGKQLFMAFKNKNDYNNILTDIKNNSNIEYYVIYADNNIKNYYLLYFQSPEHAFCFTKKYKQYCHLYFRNNSYIIYDYIKKNCEIIKEFGKYYKLRTNINRKLNEKEFMCVKEITQKIDDFYKTDKDDISDDDQDNGECQTEIESDDNKKYKKFKPVFRQSVQPIIIPSLNNNINFESWKTNLSYDIKQIKILYFYGMSDVLKTDKIKEFIRNNQEEYGKFINIVNYDGNYWYGIGDAYIAIYDNFKEKHLNIFELLEFIDNEVHELKTKNGNVKNNYKLIIFNSIENIEFSYINVPIDLKHKIISSMKIIKCE